VKKALTGQSGTDIVYDVTGEKAIITYKPVMKYGWVLIMQELYSEAYSTISSLLVGIVVLIALSILLSIFITCALYRYIMRYDAQ
jgi:hypothetical protein